MPEISIIIPFYNRASFLKETLVSIINQSFNDFEVLIIDDGSDDIQLMDIKAYLHKLKDSRISLLNKTSDYPKGANGSRNYGFYQTKGEYVKWFDSDDIMNFEFLSVQISILKENPNIDGVLGNCGIYNEDFSIQIKPSWRKKIFSDFPLRDYLKGQLAWQTGAGLWKKSSLLQLDPFCQNISNAQEYIFHLFVLTSNFELVVIEKEMFKIRTHPNSISKNRTENYILNRFRARTIALSRLIYTKNPGKLYVLKALLKMYSKYGIKNNRVYSNVFYNNFNYSIGIKTTAILKKIKWNY